MPLMTANQLMDAAYRKIGIKSPSSAEDTSALQDLQNMLASWSDDGLMVPYFATENFTLTSGTSVYTIGGDQDEDFSTTIPVRIHAAFIRVSSADYPIDVNMTKLEYTRIYDKTVSARPTRLYYDPQYAGSGEGGDIQFNYVPDSAYDFHMVSEKVLTEPTAITSNVLLPQSFNQAIVYNLAILLSHDKNVKLSNSLFGTADRSLEAIMGKHASNTLIEPVTLEDISVLTYSGSTMNINTGA